MKSNFTAKIILTAGLIHAAFPSSAKAQLPSLNEKAWLGYYVGLEMRKTQFTIASDGKSSIRPLGKNGAVVGTKNFIDVNFVVEETQPSGKIVMKPLIPESLASEKLATNKPKDMLFTGKVAGDAAFEVHVTEERGAILLGGRVTDKGTLTNPVRLVICVKFPDSYSGEKIDEANKQELKKLENKMEKDQLQLMFVDGKRLKISASKLPEADFKAASGNGISAAKFECAGYPNLKFNFSAQPNSAMKIKYDEAKFLNKGFDLNWSADPEKDPEGKSRLIIDLK